MTRDMDRIFISSAPEGLETRILARVDLAERQAHKRKAVAGMFASAALAVALVFAAREAVNAAALSGFGQYLSLAFTGGSAALADWRDLGLTIIESAPVMGAALFLGAAGLLAAAVRWTAQSVRGSFALAS